jgi:hypothetical protein
MSVGLNPSKGEVDNQAGVIARDLDSATSRVLDFKNYLDGKQEADLVALGYTPEEVGILKSAFTDAAKLAAIFRGEIADPAVYDYRTFLKQIWGFGAL